MARRVQWIIVVSLFVGLTPLVTASSPAARRAMSATAAACTPQKKCPKAPTTLPANGGYAGATDASVRLSVFTKSGKRFVTASMVVPLTCPATGTSGSLLFRMPAVPLRVAFGKSSDPAAPTGSTAISGRFLSAKRVRLHARIVNYQAVAGGVACSGTRDLTTNLRRVSSR